MEPQPGEIAEKKTLGLSVHRILPKSRAHQYCS